MAELEKLEKKIGYTFKRKELLLQAVTHPSYRGDGHNVPDYERLEFLGDAALELIVTAYLFRKYPDVDEGELTRYRALLVNREILARDARKLGLGEFLLLGHGESKSGGRERKSILSNAIEALIGAVFLDGGYSEAEKVAERIILNDVEVKLNEFKDVKNYKSLLQEYVQKKFNTIPVYVVTKEEGPPHRRTFEVDVKIKDSVMGKGKGKSIREAQLSAAEEALKKLQEDK